MELTCFNGEHIVPWKGEGLASSVDAAGPPPSVLSLHGGGPSGRGGTEYLGLALAEAGHTTLRFDFAGWGDSSGDRERQSLEKRIDQVRTILAFFGIEHLSTLIGSSMGGYIAASLAAELAVENLVLFCPAAYSRRARTLEFGSGFTELIRSKDSFMDSDIPELLASFRGRALLIMGSDDAIIPEPVVSMYRKALSSCHSLETATIDGCPHPIHRWLATRPVERQGIVETVLRFVSGDGVELKR